MSVTESEEDLVEDVIEREGAQQIERWSRTDPDYTDDTFLQWTDEDETIVVYIEKEILDDEPRYTARAEPDDDDVPLSKKSIERLSESLESAIDEAVQWMRRHRPGVDMPTFTARIEGGIFKPLMNVIRRFGGGKTLIEARQRELYFESASHVNQVEFTISTADMKSYDVEQAGEVVVDSSFLWDALKGVNYSDTVPVAFDAGQERPKLQVADSSDFGKVSADFFRRSAPEPFPYTAQFAIQGLEFRDVTKAARVTDADSAIIGALDGVAFIQAISADQQVEFTGRFETTELEGEQVVLIAHDRLQNLRKTVPRPSQTDLRFTLKDNDPMLVEFGVDGTNVDVLIALMTGPIPREFDFPPEEITVPEDTAADEQVEAAAEESETVTVGWPEAVEYLRQHYGDSYEERIGLSSDLSSFADEHGYERVAALGDEGVTQPLIRYQDVPPEDAWNQIENYAGDDAEAVRDIIIAYAAADAVTLARSKAGESDVSPPDEEEPPDEETASILVSLIGGAQNYNVPGRIPGAVEDEAIGAARDTLGPPGQFDVNDTVGQVTFRGSDVESISLEAGQDRLSEETDEESPDGDDGDGADGEDLLTLPVSVDEAFHDGFIYVTPHNTVNLEVSNEIDQEMEDRLGDAGQYQSGVWVGKAFVTPEDNAMARELVRVKPDSGLLEDDQDVEAVEEPPTPAEEPDELSRGEMETIIEQATRGITVDLQKMADEFRQFRLDVVQGEGIRFRQDADRITASSGDAPGETIRNALERWNEFAIIDRLDPDDVAEINQKREALIDQFGIEIPLLPQPTIEGLDDEDIQRIVQRGTQGVDAEVSINPDADSLRIRMEPVRESQAAYSATLGEVQGQASNPGGAIREALEEWEDAVDGATVNIERVNRRRGRLGREFDMSLPEIEAPSSGTADARDRSELVDEWNTIMEDLETVPIDKDRISGQEDQPIPVEIDEQFAEKLDNDEAKQIEQGLQVHHTDEIHEDVHAFIAQLLGAEPENFYDGSKPSELPNYDRYYQFTLSRNNAPGEWTNPRFAPSTLFEILAPLDGDRIKILARGAPLA
jgi:hypothetical protein